MKEAQPALGDAPIALVPFVRDFIESHLAVYDNNNLGLDSRAQAWDGLPLGFSSGTDELYPFLKRHIGDFHWTPAEAFALGRAVDLTPDALQLPPAVPVPGEELAVISLALMQTEETKSANRCQTRWPSEPWARARIYGQRCVRRLQQALVEALETNGYEAVAPALLPECTQKESREYGEAFPWSERHVAYISGLGTFGLSGGLITERGMAHRLASVVVRAKLEPTARPYDDPFAYCLHYATGACAECAGRCPAGSISPDGRDKPACAAQLQTTGDLVKQEYGFDGYGCGLCQTGVPCESQIPREAAVTHAE